MRYEYTIKQINNGWLFVSSLPGQDWVELYFETEIEVLIALKVAAEKMIELTQQESQAEK